MTALAPLTGPSVCAGPGTTQIAPLTVADTLRQAADRIEQVGLWQGGVSNSDIGSECAVTAIWAVVGSAEGAQPVAYALRDHLGLPNLGAVFRWNDAASSVDVVTSKLRLAADAADGGSDR